MSLRTLGWSAYALLFLLSWAAIPAPDSQTALGGSIAHAVAAGILAALLWALPAGAVALTRRLRGKSN